MSYQLCLALFLKLALLFKIIGRLLCSIDNNWPLKRNDLLVGICKDFFSTPLPPLWHHPGIYPSTIQQSYSWSICGFNKTLYAVDQTTLYVIFLRF